MAKGDVDFCGKQMNQLVLVSVSSASLKVSICSLTSLAIFLIPGVTSQMKVYGRD